MADRTMIRIDGLVEFQRALRDLDSAMPKLLRQALNEASQLVIDRARPGIPRRSGRAAQSLKVRSSQRKAAIAAGGRRAPYYPWLDFGGRTGPGRSVNRPFLTEGRYIYPALRRNRDEITRKLEAAVAEVARAAGVEVT